MIANENLYSPGIKNEIKENTNRNVRELDVTKLEPRLKHPTIFKYFDDLKGGEGFQIFNDHDPKPLYYQLIAERGNIFSWKYLEKGPERWRVQIEKTDIEHTVTIGELAAADVRNVEVFKTFGIDFYCGGKKSLMQACKEVGANINEVETALEKFPENSTSSDLLHFNLWQPDVLADYIYYQHHVTYYKVQPIISELAEKVIERHSSQYPHLLKIRSTFHFLKQELNAHFLKEEKVVFPYIKALQKARQTADLNELEGYPSMKEPVQMMEADHEAAGEILDALKKIANNYKPSTESSELIHHLYKLLADFDEDFRQHMHLENNILFPKALELEKVVMMQV